MKNIQYICQYAIDQIKKVVDKLGKPTCLIIVGLFIFFVGLIMYNSRPRVIYTESGEFETGVMSEDAANSMVESLLPKLLNIYEKPSDVFKVKDVSKKEETTTEEEPKKEETKKEDAKEEPVINGLLIEDYDNVMANYFTKDGITEFEKTKFGDKSYFNKVDDKVYFMNDVVPDGNKFSNDAYSISGFVIDEDEISCKIYFSRLLINELDEVSYEVYTKKLVLVKKEVEEEKKEKETVWLVDSFNYANIY